ncbi:MAG: oligosaccharide flippase family protein, partial [Nitrososphaerota archaeon]
MADELTRVAEDSARGSFFLVTGTAFATIIMAVSSIIVARLLGPESYGQYTLALVVPGMLFLFTDLGINHGVIRYTASLRQKKQVENITKIIRYGLTLRVLVGATTFIVTYLFSDVFASLLLQRPDLAWFVKITSLSILFQVISTTVSSSFVGLDKTEYNALITNIHAITKAITSIVLVILGFDVFGAILGHVIGYIISAAIGMLILAIMLRGFRQQSLGENPNPNDDSILKDLVKYGAPLYVAL